MSALPAALDLAALWADFEDRLVPQLCLAPSERALYSYLFRHSHLEGTRALALNVRDLSQRAHLPSRAVAVCLRHLARKGCVRLFDAGRAGHCIEVLTPKEILAGIPPAFDALFRPRAPSKLRDLKFRRATWLREGSRCFYCLREISVGEMELDHVVPQAAGGDSSERNLVACCSRCNQAKSDFSAEEFLRLLFRKNRLSECELDDRFRALESICPGHLPPQSAGLVPQAIRFDPRK